MDFTIREPQKSDAEAIARVHVESWKETYGHLLPEDFFGGDLHHRRLGMWQRMLASGTDPFVVRVGESSEGEIVGFILIGPSDDPKTAPRKRSLFAIYVMNSHHGTGMGQALLDAGLGDDPAVLQVEKTNLRAQAFYRRNGFEFDGVEDVDERHPALVDVQMVR